MASRRTECHINILLTPFPEQICPLEAVLHDNVVIWETETQRWDRQTRSMPHCVPSSTSPGLNVSILGLGSVVNDLCASVEVIQVIWSHRGGLVPMLYVNAQYYHTNHSCNTTCKQVPKVNIVIGYKVAHATELGLLYWVWKANNQIWALI